MAAMLLLFFNYSILYNTAITVTLPENGTKKKIKPITATMGMCSLAKTWWRWGWDVALSVPLLLMLPSAISFSKLLRMFFITRPEPVREKVVLITGASSGIGQRMAWEYAKRGANLVVVARRRNRLEEVAKECKAYGAQNAVVCPADLTKPQDCKRIVEFTVSTFGQLDVLVNNAGAAGGSLFEEYENAAEYKRIVGKLPWWFPMARTEDAAREIVEAALRKERDVIIPRWYSSLLWFRILCPEILEWVSRVFILGQAPTRAVEIVCNSVLGKFNTHALFKTLKLA